MMPVAFSPPASMTALLNGRDHVARTGMARHDGVAGPASRRHDPAALHVDTSRARCAFLVDQYSAPVRGDVARGEHRDVGAVVRSSGRDDDRGVARPGLGAAAGGAQAPDQDIVAGGVAVVTYRQVPGEPDLEIFLERIIRAVEDVAVRGTGRRSPANM